MTLAYLLRMLWKRLPWLVGLPLVMALTVALLTRNQPKEYAAHTTLYTGLVSGYSVGNSSDGKVDFHAVRSAFDNLVGTIEARDTAEDLAMRLLATYLAAPDSVRQRFAPATGTALTQVLPRSAQAALTRPTVAATLRRIRHKAAAHRAPALHRLIYEAQTPFSIRGIRRTLKAKRIGASDLLEIRYTTTDPFLCKQTLDLLLDVFATRYQTLRQEQVNGVVRFFEQETEDAAAHLRDHVDRLRRFGVENEIVNYQEQTEAVTMERETTGRQLQMERMRLNAARAALHTLEDKMAMQTDVMKENDTVLRLRERLSALSAQQALRDAPAPDVQTEMDTLRSRLSRTLRRLYDLNTSATGLNRTTVLDAWLDKLLVVTESEARVAVLNERMDAFRDRYRRLAPLGSELTTINREVDIAENEYLELLHSLNMARMRKQNVRMATDLNVVDAPFLPERPVGSNRLVLVAGAGVAGFVLVASVVLGLALLNSTLATPQIASTKTGLDVASAYPVVHPPDDAPAFQDALLRTLDTRLLQTLQRTERDAPADASPRLYIVASTREAEGKTVVAKRLAESLRALGDTVCQATPPDAPLARVSTLAALHPDADSADALVLELPALHRHTLPMALLERAAAVLLVARSDRAWRAADAHTLDAMRAATPRPPLLVLNGVSTDALDPLVGEVPRERSALRTWLKRVARLEWQRPLPFSPITNS